MKKYLCLSMALSALGLFLCADTALAAKAQAPQSDPVKIPVAIIASDVEEDFATVAEIVQASLSAAESPLEGGIPLQIEVKAFDAPASSIEADSLSERLREGGIVAALCLTKGPDAWHVPRVAVKAHIPTIMLFSETLSPGPESHGLSPFLFGLDVDESYRPEALALLASGLSEKRWVVLVDHLDLKSRTAGTAASQAMSGSGLDVQTIFLPNSTETHMKAALNESVENGTGGFVSFMSPLGTLKAARVLFPMAKGAKLLYGFEPTDLLTLAEGVIALRQQMTPGLNHPGGELAARATVACRWLVKGLSSLREDNLDTNNLAEAMAAVERIPLEGGFLEISPGLHRPARKDLQVLEAKGGAWVEKARLRITPGSEGGWTVTPGKRHETSSENP